MLYIFVVTWNYQNFSWYIFIKVSSYLYLIIGQPSALHTFDSESLCVCTLLLYQDLLNLQQTMHD